MLHWSCHRPLMRVMAGSFIEANLAIILRLVAQKRLAI